VKHINSRKMKFMLVFLIMLGVASMICHGQFSESIATMKSTLAASEVFINETSDTVSDGEVVEQQVDSNEYIAHKPEYMMPACVFQYEGDDIEFSLETTGEVTIVWGDGNSEVVTSGTVSHKYSEVGQYGVRIDEDKISSLDFSGLLGLKELRLLESSNLEFLECDNTELNHLEVLGCEKLRYLVCNNTKLSVLDLSANPNLEYLYYGDGIGTIKLNEECKTVLKLSGSSETAIEYVENVQEVLPKLTVNESDMILDLGEEFGKYEVGFGAQWYFSATSWYTPALKEDVIDGRFIEIDEFGKIHLAEVSQSNSEHIDSSAMWLRSKEDHSKNERIDIPTYKIHLEGNNEGARLYNSTGGMGIYIEGVEIDNYSECMPGYTTRVFIEAQSGYKIQDYQVFNKDGKELYLDVNKYGDSQKLYLSFKMPSEEIWLKATAVKEADSSGLPDFTINEEDMSIDLGKDCEKYDVSYSRNTNAGMWYSAKEDFYNPYTIVTRGSKLMLSELTEAPNINYTFIKERDKSELGQKMIKVPRYDINIQSKHATVTYNQTAMPLTKVTAMVEFEKGYEYQSIAMPKSKVIDVKVEKVDENKISLTFDMPRHDVDIIVIAQNNNISEDIPELYGTLESWNDTRLAIENAIYILSDDATIYVNGIKIESMDKLAEILSISDTTSFNKVIKGMVSLNDEGKINELNLLVAGNYDAIGTTEAIVLKVKETSKKYEIQTTKGNLDWKPVGGEYLDFPTVYVDGEEEDIRDITVGNVLTIVGTPGLDILSNVKTIYASTKIVTGKATEIKKDNNAITIGDVVYPATDMYVQMIENELDEDNFKPLDSMAVLESDEVTLYLNVCGEYVAVEVMPIDKFEYAIVTSKVGEVEDNVFEVDVITVNGEETMGVHSYAVEKFEDSMNCFVEYSTYNEKVQNASVLVNIDAFYELDDEDATENAIMSGEETKLADEIVAIIESTSNEVVKASFKVNELNLSEDYATIKYDDSEEASLGTIRFDPNAIVYIVESDKIEKITLSELEKRLEHSSGYIIPFKDTKADANANILVAIDGFEAETFPSGGGSSEEETFPSRGGLFEEDSTTIFRQFKDVKEGDWYYDLVTRTDYLEGTTKVTFSPNDPLTREMFIVALYNIAEASAVTGTNIFPDIPEGAWSEEAIIWASVNNLVIGYPDGRFKPSENITRQEAIVIVKKFADHVNYPTDKRADLTAFNDYTEIYDWAVESMSWAVAEGIISGDNHNMLSATRDLTRAELLAIFNNATKRVL